VASPDAESILIRTFDPDDSGPLGDLLLELSRDPASVHFHPHPFTRDEARRIAHRTGIQDDLYFGAFRDGRLIGYGMLRGWDEGYEIPAFGVAVGVGYRGAGVGRSLLRYAIAAARSRGARTLMLKVHPGNPNAKRLYESEGFSFDPAQLVDGQMKGLLGL
jgi:ribosomal protein S18 acetylase RimI-like enzyme